MQEEKYNPGKIEKKWQKIWIKNKTNFIDLKDKSKPKFYNLVMFFYPSGAKIHIGHVYNYTGSDVYGRYKRLKGFNVFEPMGYDAFGLPAENYAIKTGVHPAISTRENINYGRQQLKSLGTMYDWEKEIDTSSPEYYKWTQWLFGILYKTGLAYRALAPVNWCPSCKTVLANEQVINGKCERCGSEVISKNLKQWFFKITEYADKLLDGHKNLNWPQKTITMQKNWIGRKEWIDIKYPVKSSDQFIEVSTTRPDTNFGATFIVIAPEHSICQSNLIPLKQKIKVQKYVKLALAKTEEERITGGRKKTGVFTGLYAINQLNHSEMPIWVADFVLPTVGTGAVVGVPGHDKRDFAFAQEFNLPIIRVVIGKDGDRSEITKIEQVQEEEGKMVNSKFLDGLDIHKATQKIMNYLEEKGWGKRTIRYHLRDWLISRQRYWGAPIPLIFCPKCKKSEKFEIRNSKFENKGEMLNPGWILVHEKDLPIKLPDLKDFKPTDKGESPLTRSKEFINVKCPKCGQPAKRSAETMDTFVCSSWYFLRFISPHLSDKPFDKELANYWLPIDQYCGGAEHACMHLLYARFINMVLHDQGYINFTEPFTKLNHQGMILAADGTKMSKSKGNVVIPDEYIKKYGADVFRMYVLFLAPFSEGGSWNDQGIMGIKRFLDKVWNLVNDKCQNPNVKSMSKSKCQILLNQTIKKVTEDIENFQFNTAISALMILVNEMQKNNKQLLITDYQLLVTLLSPFAPHIAEELWKKLGHKTSIFEEKWPEYDPDLIKKDQLTIVIQINGKVRGSIEVDTKTDEDKIKNKAQSEEKIQKWLIGKEIKKTIYVAGKLINFVI